jgi:hypothetical protein
MMKNNSDKLMLIDDFDKFEQLMDLYIASCGRDSQKIMDCQKVFDKLMLHIVNELMEHLETYESRGVWPVADRRIKNFCWAFQQAYRSRESGYDDFLREASQIATEFKRRLYFYKQEWKSGKLCKSDVMDFSEILEDPKAVTNFVSYWGSHPNDTTDLDKKVKA